MEAFLTITIIGANEEPIITIATILTINEDSGKSALTFSLADFEDLDSSLTLIIESNATNGVVTIDGTDVTYTPNSNYYGTDTFIVSTTDSNGAKVTKTINVTIVSVNDIPSITIASTLSTNEDNNSALTFSLADIEDSNLTLTVESSPSNGTVTIDGTDITYTPHENYFGTDTFTVSTTDSSGAKVTKTISVTVISVNDAPTITIDSTLSTNEDSNSELTFSLADIEDLDSDLTLTIESNPSNGTIAIDGTDITYTPNENYFGTDTFTVSTTDSNGEKVTKTITLTIISVNDIPIITIASTLTTNEDNNSELTFSLSDIEDSNLILAVESNATNGTVTIDGTKITYTPNENYYGTDSFIVSTTDSNGAKVTKTINVTVVSVNDTPTIIINPTLSTNEDSVGILAFSLADVESSSLTLNIESNAINGTVEIDGSEVIYTPNENYFGSDTFILSTTDSNGAKVTKTINVTVVSVNDIPTINSISSTNGQGSITLAFILFDIEDSDLTLDIESNATNGLLAIDGTDVTYTPDGNYYGTDTFMLSTTDNNGAKVTKTVNVTVANVNNITTIFIDPTLIIAHPAIDLIEVDSLEEFQNTVSVAGNHNEIKLNQDKDTGNLTAQIGESIYNMRSVDITVAPEGAQAGITITSDGLVVFVSDKGSQITMMAELDSLDGLVNDLQSIGFTITQLAYGVIRVTFVENTRQSSGRSWYAFRSSYDSIPAETGAIEGIFSIPSPQLINTEQFVYYFNKENVLYRQILYPTPADWNSLKNYLNKLGEVSIDTSGIITYQVNNVSIKALMSYQVEPSNQGNGNLQAIAIDDQNDDGLSDYVIIYPNGDKQTVYHIQTSESR